MHPERCDAERTTKLTTRLLIIATRCSLSSNLLETRLAIKLVYWSAGFVKKKSRFLNRENLIIDSGYRYRLGTSVLGEAPKYREKRKSDGSLLANIVSTSKQHYVISTIISSIPDLGSAREYQ